jgi:hypothetical protein
MLETTSFKYAYLHFTKYSSTLIKFMSNKLYRLVRPLILDQRMLYLMLSSTRILLLCILYKVLTGRKPRLIFCRGTLRAPLPSCSVPMQLQTGNLVTEIG